jgi:LPPG:FO 2-phospho-L-lactate transferase
VKVTVLVGGVGGARFLLGVQKLLGLGQFSGGSDDHELTAVVNVGDDAWMHGVRICPDLDTCMYTLGGGVDPERGWGHRDETWHAMEELARYGMQPDWFGLGDRDLATHLVRTQMLDAGYSLSDVTTALCRRWLAPVHGHGVRLLPMSDDRVETHIAIADADAPSGRRVVHFQEYWVRLHASVPAESVVVIGLEDAKPAPGVVEAINGAELVVVPPSNPVVSVGTILGVPGVRDALVSTPAPVVGRSRIGGGTLVRGMAHQLVSSRGVEVSAGAVGVHYGARSSGGVLDGWLVDTVDTDDVPRVREAGLRCEAVPLLMTSVEATAAMAAAAVSLVA